MTLCSLLRGFEIGGQKILNKNGVSYYLSKQSSAKARQILLHICLVRPCSQGGRVTLLPGYLAEGLKDRPGLQAKLTGRV